MISLKKPVFWNIHFFLRSTRKIHTGPYIEFDRQDYEIAPASRKLGTVLFHTFRKLLVLDYSTKLTWPPIFTSFHVEIWLVLLRQKIEF